MKTYPFFSRLFRPEIPGLVAVTLVAMAWNSCFCFAFKSPNGIGASAADCGERGPARCRKVPPWNCRGLRQGHRGLECRVWQQRDIAQCFPLVTRN